MSVNCLFMSVMFLSVNCLVPMYAGVRERCGAVGFVLGCLRYGAVYI